MIGEKERREEAIERTKAMFAKYGFTAEKTQSEMVEALVNGQKVTVNFLVWKKIDGFISVDGKDVSYYSDDWLTALEKLLQWKLGSEVELKKLEDVLRKSSQLLWQKGRRRIWHVKDTDAVVIVDTEIGHIYLHTLSGVAISECTPRGFTTAFKNALLGKKIQSLGMEEKNG